MRVLNLSNRLCRGIFMVYIVLISACATQHKPTMSGELEPKISTVEEMTESYDPTFAVALDKVCLGTIRPEGIIHPHFTTISPDGHKVAYAASIDKVKWHMVIENLKSHDLVKGPDFESVSVPTFSPDGTKVAYTAMQNSKRFIMIDDKKGPEFDNISVPVFSPDGSKIAYVAMQDGKQFIVINGEKGPEFDLVYSLIAFSPDGSQVAYGAKQGAKSFILVGGKKSPEFDMVDSPIFNPMGDKVAYIARQGDEVFVMVDGKKGPEFDGVRRDLIFSPDGKKLACVAQQATEGKGFGSMIVVLELHDNNDLTLLKTFGPLTVSATRAQPETNANLSGIGWSTCFSIDGSKLAYGVNGGPLAAIEEPIRTRPPGRHYFITMSVLNSTIEINGNVVANIINIGLVTPFSFSPDSKELSWIVLTKDREIYLKKLKLK